MAGYTVSSVTSGKYARQVTVAASGPQGAEGPTGPAGAGVPTGGSSGQILVKTSDSSYATAWVDPESIENVAMSELTDVDVSSLTDGQVLVYDQSTSSWVPTSPANLPQSTEGLSGIIEGGSASSF